MHLACVPTSVQYTPPCNTRRHPLTEERRGAGNVVDPKSVIGGGKDQKLEPALGADVLRLWVSSGDDSGDVRVGANIMKQVSDAYCKIRNTLRYLIGNMYDFNPRPTPSPTRSLRQCVRDFV